MNDVIESSRGNIQKDQYPNDNVLSLNKSSDSSQTEGTPYMLLNCILEPLPQ